MWEEAQKLLCNSFIDLKQYFHVHYESFIMRGHQYQEHQRYISLEVMLQLNALPLVLIMELWRAEHSTMPMKWPMEFHWRRDRLRRTTSLGALAASFSIKVRRIVSSFLVVGRAVVGLSGKARRDGGVVVGLHVAQWDSAS
jgi:hypothetical protein